MDQIVVMKDGKFSEIGTYRQLLENGGDFAGRIVIPLSHSIPKEWNAPMLENKGHK